MEADSLWQRMIRSKYGVNDNSWDARFMMRVQDEIRWKTFLTDFFLLECCKLAVANGEMISGVMWLETEALEALFSRLYSLSSKCNEEIAIFAYITVYLIAGTLDLEGTLTIWRGKSLLLYH